MTAPSLIGPAFAPELHVMSFNIRRAMEGSLHPKRDRWVCARRQSLRCSARSVRRSSGCRRRCPVR